MQRVNLDYNDIVDEYKNINENDIDYYITNKQIIKKLPKKSKQLLHMYLIVFINNNIPKHSSSSHSIIFKKYDKGKIKLRLRVNFIGIHY